MSTKKTSAGKFGMRRTAIALAVASAFGLGANAAFAVAPVVNSFWPRATGSGVNAEIAADLQLNFDQNVTAVTGKNINIYKSDTTLVEAVAADNTSKVTVSGGNVTINPTADLALGTDYYVQIDAGAFQNAGVEAYAGIADTTTWNFTTGAAATVIGYGPINGATTFSETAYLGLWFSENVTAASGKNVKIYKSDGTLVESIAANDTTKVTVIVNQVTFQPTANLVAGSYYVQIDAGAFTGNTSSASYAGIADTTTWAFTVVADATAPTVTFSHVDNAPLPGSNATNVAPNANLVLYFYENVTAVGGKSINIYKSDNTLVETIAANDTGKVTVSGSQVTINPAADLSFNTGYYVQIDAGAFQDATITPNAYAGIADAIIWSFTTAAAATPTSYDPVSGATNFAENAYLSLSFGESMTAVSGKNIKIYKADNTLVETIAANDTTKVSNCCGYVAIIPAANLTAGSYYVQIDAGAFTGNTSSAGYSGIADTTTWAFTTVADTTMPTVSTYSPADNAAATSPSANFTFYFNESMAAVTGKNLKAYKSDTPLVETIAANDTGKVTVSGSKVMANPAADLALNTGYYVQIDAGAFQDATTPNAYAGISDATTWNLNPASEIPR